MKTRIISVSEEQIEEKDGLLRDAGEILKKGGLVAYAPPVVLGLLYRKAVKKATLILPEIKRRPENKLIINLAKGSSA